MATAPIIINNAVIAPNIIPRLARPFNIVVGLILANPCSLVSAAVNAGFPMAVNINPIAVIATPPAIKAAGLIPTNAPMSIVITDNEPSIMAKFSIPFKNVLGLNLAIWLKEFKAVSKDGELIGISARLNPAIAKAPPSIAEGLIRAIPPITIAIAPRPTSIMARFLRPRNICIGFNEARVPPSLRREPSIPLPLPSSGLSMFLPPSIRESKPERPPPVPPARLCLRISLAICIKPRTVGTNFIAFLPMF